MKEILVFVLLGLAALVVIILALLTYALAVMSAQADAELDIITKESCNKEKSTKNMKK